MGRQSEVLVKTARIIVLAWCFQIAWAHGPVALAQQASPQAAPAVPASQTGAPAGRGGRGPIPVDPRVQIRSYQFTDTNEEIPYAVFVSSKVRRDTKAPLVIALHGLGGTHTSLLRGNALDLAEEGGYILVGPMGYNPRGWYGVPATGRGGRGRGAGAPNPAGAPQANATGAPTAPPQAAQAPAAGTPPQGGRGAFPGGAAAGQNDPPNLRELSEKDVLNVLALILKEFNVDERRTYLMGHSMGGAGTFHMGVKQAGNWAAIAAIAPAAFGMDPKSITTVPDMPVIIVHGDMDTAVPVSVGRAWADVLKGANMTHEYMEVPGGDHGNVISIGMPNIFAFFAKHSKAAR
jgi:predicted esterase